jgi:hypothetical protein
VPELLGRHGHGSGRKLPARLGQGKLPQHGLVPALSDRALCPTFPLQWLFLRSRRRGNTSAAHSNCWRSSRTNCAPRPLACLRATIGSPWSRQRGAGCGSLWPCSGRPAALAIASYGDLCPWVVSWSRPASWPPLGLRSRCGRSGGARGVSFDWSSHCGRPGRRSQLERRRQRDREKRAGRGRRPPRGDSNAGEQEMGAACWLRWERARHTVPAEVARTFGSRKRDGHRHATS